MPDSGYFLIADILGFGRIVSNSYREKLDERIDSWVELVDSTCQKYEIDRYQLLSDSLFVSVGGTEDDLLRLIGLAQALLNRGIASSFPIRGAITYGPVTWGKLTYGKAVIEAHQLEMSQSWVGISCISALPNVDAALSPSQLVIYPAPLKSGPITLRPVVAWDVPPFTELTRSLTTGGLIKESEPLQAEWGDRVTRTILFRLYLLGLQRSGKGAERFHGILPIQFVEMNFSGGHKNS